MSIHKSLHTGGALTQHRNVLSRVERIKILEESGRWLEGRNDIFGLAKVKNIKVVAKKKVAKEVAAEGVSVTPAVSGMGGAEAVKSAGPAVPAAGAKTATPAASATKPAGKK